MTKKKQLYDLVPVLRKYVGKKLFKPEQVIFKEEFFEELFAPYAPVDYTLRSTIFINAILEEDNLPYIFSCKRETEEGEHYGETYWLLIDLDTLD